jgi:hypothetical protein
MRRTIVAPMIATPRLLKHGVRIDRRVGGGCFLGRVTKTTVTAGLVARRSAS